MGRSRCLAKVLAILMGFVAGAATGARAADAVVVAATAPGYALGQVVPDGTVIHLPDGASVMFLLVTGQTVTVKGPYQGSLARPAAPSRAGLESLFDGGGFREADLGGTRAAVPPLVWPADAPLRVVPDRDGTYCLLPGWRVTLARPAAGTETVLRSGAAEIRISWPSGMAEQPWPEAVLPLDVGGEVRATGAGGVATLRFRRVTDGSGGDGAGWIAAMAFQGCAEQATASLARLRDASAPLDLYLGTDRGRFPTYRLGEAIRLVVQTNRDAYLTCYIRDARGRVIPLFPSSVSGGARVEGHRALTLPGRRLPLALTAGDPPGDREVRCFAADQDISPLLPAEFQAGGMTPLSDDTAAALHHALENLPQTRLVVTQIVVRVE